MLLIGGEFVADTEVLFQSVTDGVQSAVSSCFNNMPFSAVHQGNGSKNTVLLFEVCVRHLEGGVPEHILVLEDPVYTIRCKLRVLAVGDVLYRIADIRLHIPGYRETVVGLEYIAYAALAGLGVDADDVAVVGAAEIFGIDGQIRYGPLAVVLPLLMPGEAFADGILVRARECGEDQLPAIRRSFIYMHAGELLVGLTDTCDIREIKSGIHAVGEQVDSKSDDIHITCPLAVSEEGTLYPVSSCKAAQLCITYARAPVVVGMERESHGVAVCEVFMNVLHLSRKYMRHCDLDSSGDVDDNLV